MNHKGLECLPRIPSREGCLAKLVPAMELQGVIDRLQPAGHTADAKEVEDLLMKVE